MKFYICRHCGNIITKLTSSKVPVHCCGEPMELLEAGVTDAAVEKSTCPRSSSLTVASPWKWAPWPIP